MESPDLIPKLLSRISYLESLLTAHNIQFIPATLPQSTQIPPPKPSPFQTSLSLDHSNPLSIPLVQRYSRQMLLPEISLPGQQRLQRAKVLVIGAGGIGCPALYYLAGMGVGTIGIMDGDVIEETNLHRQILHNNARVGVNKAISAFQTLREYNPNVNYRVYQERLGVGNVSAVISEYDIVLDASDNALTRYLVNDAGFLHGKKVVSGAALGWEGQLTVFGQKKNGPCYRCLFPVCPRNMQSCGEAGVVGMVPGLIGLLEAMEALKIIIGVEGVLAQEMLVYDGIRTVFKKIKLRGRQKDCILCGDNPTLTNIQSYDYDEFVGSSACPVFPKMAPENNLSWVQAIDLYNKEKENLCLIDCRPETQFKIVSLDPWVNLPMEVFSRLSKEELEGLIRGKKTMVMCRRGNWSRTAVKLLLESGFEGVYNIEGGINGFGDQGFGEVPKI